MDENETRQEYNLIVRRMQDEWIIEEVQETHGE